MRSSDLVRTLCHGGLVALALLAVGFWGVSVHARPPSSALLQLPTRPPTSAPLPPPPTPVPPPTSGPSPQQPTPVPLLGPTATAPSPTPTPIPGVDLTFEELGYATFHLSESGSRGIDLHLPRNLVPNNDRSYLDLVISHTPPEPDKTSAISLTLNGAAVAVIVLSPENAEPTSYRFYLRDTPLISGHNQLHVYLDTGAACNIRGAQVDVAIHGDSVFHLEYSLDRYSPDLALYPFPFFERSFEYEPVYIVLPETPSTTDLSAAATIAAGLGKFSNGEIRLASILDTQIPADIRSNYHLIVIGKVGANRFLESLSLPLLLDDPALSEGHGVIEEIVSPWNPLRMILVVTGNSDEALFKASQALNRETHLLDMQGSVAIVEMVLPPEPVESRQPAADFTVADLGYGEEVVYGTRPRELVYRFPMPVGFAITEEVWFTLYFGHARIVSPANSSLSVHLNDVPISSVLLDGGNADGETLQVPLPPWLIHPGINEVRISIEMNLEDEDKCLFLDAKQLWTAIYSNSYFHLPFTTQEVLPSLDLFPYPFDEWPSLSGLLVVLPDRPSQFDYDRMLELAAGLGAADQGEALALQVITADLVTQESRLDKDLVLIGRSSGHSLIAELNDNLPQPFEPDLDLLRSQIESAAFAQDPSRDVGLIEELAAPWDTERTILVLTGTTDEGVALAVRTLFSRGGGLAGNVALVEDSIGIRTFDTRPFSPAPAGGTGRLDAGQTLLVQLGERWW